MLDSSSDLPPINALGPKAAEKSPRLNAAIRAQLGFIAEEAKHYITAGQRMAGRNPGLEKKMPHEWGSLDSFDDMRNALAVGLALMDNLIMGSQPEEEAIRDAIADRGVCASDPGVWDAAFPDEPDGDKRQDIIFARLENQ